MVETDENKFMRRCLELASKAEGLTYPNPMVGSVIVYEDKIIGEGYHLRAGEAHAEVNAVNSVKDASNLSSSTLYVNLEPCSHYGKTPPCADFIISHKIPRVVIGTIDTSDKVSGQGIKKLRDAGCEVRTGILENECRSLNKRFFTYNEKKRPYIILKWAQSADGFLDIERTENHKQEPNWITGKPEKILVHKWRASEQTILVGAETIRTDAPKLNVREWKGPDPVKLVLSSSGNVDTGSFVNRTSNSVIVFTHNSGSYIPDAKKIQLKDNVSSATQISDYLYDAGFQSLFVEGGGKVLNHFIAEGLWDEARIFKGPEYFKRGVKAPLIDGIHNSETVFSGSILEIYLRR
jgi:diaminohydroxyphosphoribosylaminopyrimidine deaminase / 5-amino-6-(5-phosphoribosylamino)uracil reductase